MTKIIFATKNNGKLKEIKSIMQDMPFDILSMEEAGFTTEVVEDGSTFEANAMKKATEIMNECGLITLADDSGLEVDFLDKAPGVYSARYMGEGTSYTVKNAHIIKLLENAPKENRTARFVSVIAAAFPNTNRVLTSRGTIEGYIAYEPKGENGFGYDPIFFYPPMNCTTAELDMDTKNMVSHRGKALRAMKELLKAELGLD